MSGRPANPSARRQLCRLAGAVLATGSLLSACGGTPAGGDPGGTRLQELSSDRVFAALPAQATPGGVKKTPAHYQKPGFTGGGWMGPSVVVTFTSSAAPAEVFQFFDSRAAAAGWQPTATGALGLTDRWSKDYADGASATLFLASLGNGSERTYLLSGGVAPVQ